MSKENGKKKKKKSLEIRKLNKGDKFVLSENNNLKGVVLSVSDMETSVYWYSIPSHWFKKYYDEKTLENEDGSYYEGLDTYFYKRKVSVSSSTNVIKIKKGE